jgi:adenylate kinase
MGNKLIFLGPPGAGKGTQAAVLADFLGIPHISTGDILRKAISDNTPLGQKAQSYVDRGDLVPDNLILDLIRERLNQEDAQKGWILDGFPRNLSQAGFLDQLLAELQQVPDHVVNFDVPDEALIARMLGRGRKDDNEETIRNRLQVYREQTAPVIDYYRQGERLTTVDGDRTEAEVTASLQGIVQLNG